MRRATALTLQRHEIQPLSRKIALQNPREIHKQWLKRHLQRRRIREWSDHDPNPNWSSRTRPFGQLTCQALEAHFVLKKIISHSGYLPKFHQMLHLPPKMTLALHQVLHLLQKVTLQHQKLTVQHQQMLHLPRKVALRHHQSHEKWQ